MKPLPLTLIVMASLISMNARAVVKCSGRMQDT